MPRYNKQNHPRILFPFPRRTNRHPHRASSRRRRRERRRIQELSTPTKIQKKFASIPVADCKYARRRLRNTFFHFSLH